MKAQVAEDRLNAAAMRSSVALGMIDEALKDSALIY
jgi:hypothetical protein